MKKFLNTIFTGMAVFLAIPTILILASWNALPGDFLYPVKTGLEDIVLSLTMHTPFASAFSMKFTDRRFSEATRLLAKKGSTIGYGLLVEEAQQTKDIIVKKQDTTKGSELVVKIEEYQKNIEEKQLTTTLPQEPSSNQETILEDLEETNQELEEIKEEIKEKLPEAASEKAQEKQKENKKENKKEKEDHENIHKKENKSQSNH
jgi:prephenate dehydrogenase